MSSSPPLPPPPPLPSKPSAYASSSPSSSRPLPPVRQDSSDVRLESHFADVYATLDTLGGGGRDTPVSLADRRESVDPLDIYALYARGVDGGRMSFVEPPQPPQQQPRRGLPLPPGAAPVGLPPSPRPYVPGEHLHNGHGHGHAHSSYPYAHRPSPPPAPRPLPPQPQSRAPRPLPIPPGASPAPSSFCSNRPPPLQSFRRSTSPFLQDVPPARGAALSHSQTLPSHSHSSRSRTPQPAPPPLPAPPAQQAPYHPPPRSTSSRPQTGDSLASYPHHTSSPSTGSSSGHGFVGGFASPGSSSASASTWQPSLPPPPEPDAFLAPPAPPEEVLVREDPYAPSLHRSQSANISIADFPPSAHTPSGSTTHLIPPAGGASPAPSSLHAATLPLPTTSTGRGAYTAIDAKGRLWVPGADGGFGAGPSGGFDEDGFAYDEFGEDDEVPFDPGSMVKPQLLRDLAVQLRDRVPRGTHIKGSIPFENGFTGKDIVTTLRSVFPAHIRDSPVSRTLALSIARSLQSQLFFFEVDFDIRLVSDDVHEVYFFPDDALGGGGGGSVTGELPTGVVTSLTNCYSLVCNGDGGCYSYSCPYRSKALHLHVAASTEEEEETQASKDWTEHVDPELLMTLSRDERERQSVIYQALESEAQYVSFLDTLENLFMRPLFSAKPAIIPALRLDDFVHDAFSNLLDVRENNRRLVERLQVRQREQSGVIQTVGDIFLAAFVEWLDVYPDYVGRLANAEAAIKAEAEQNEAFRAFLEECQRKPEAKGQDLKTFIARPSHRLQRYPAILNTILKETPEGNADVGFLVEAMQAVKRLQDLSTLVGWQVSDPFFHKAQGWADLVPKEVVDEMDKKEIKRQNQIFEVIKTEQNYVKDLERFNTIFIRPLRDAEPPIIPNNKIDHFIYEVFSNWADLWDIHRGLLRALHARQREQHPKIDSITDCLLDAALNWDEAYATYMPHYPLAKDALDEETAINERFREFLHRCSRIPETRRQELNAYLMAPTQRLQRYPLLMRDLLKETPESHPDQVNLPETMEVIEAKIKEIDLNVGVMTEKVKLRKYSKSILQKDGSPVRLDLTSEMRTLVHEGKVIRVSEGTTSMTTTTSDIHMMLFDHYLVLCKEKEHKTGEKYFQLWKRPIPLDLLELHNFAGPSHHRSVGRIRIGGRDTDASGAPRSLYPFTFISTGRPSLEYMLFTETEESRRTWHEKLENALFLHQQVQEETNKVFELVPLSLDTFPAIVARPGALPVSEDNPLTGLVTCSVPFTTPDGRRLVAIGCAEGLWIGLRQEPASLRRVLHLKNVTQCAVLEEFGIFIVLADKMPVAYSIEALVPSSTSTRGPALSRSPQKMSSSRDVSYFSVGKLSGRTLVILMKKKGIDSVFRVLEPHMGNIQSERQQSNALNRLLGGGKSEWFRDFKTFFIPDHSTDLLFLKAKLAIVGKQTFEIMDLMTLHGGSIPDVNNPKNQRDQQVTNLLKRCEGVNKLTMCKSGESEFLLVYQQFGFFVDRHGDPHKLQYVTEWEGRPESAACHWPYILLFDPDFIEVRDLETLKLVQIIRGNDIRCSCNGNGLTSHFAHPQLSPDSDPTPRVHAVMRVDPDSYQGAGRRGMSTQRVFELQPLWHFDSPPPIVSPSQSFAMPIPTNGFGAPIPYGNGGYI